MVRVWNNSASNKLWVRQLMVLYYWRMVSRWVVCTAFESAILFLHSLHYMFLWTHIICHEYGTTSSCIQNALFNSIFQMDPWKLRGYECIVMTCQWRWLESLTICQNLPSLQCKVALFVSLVFVLGWMVDSTSISKALLIYLFIYFWVWGRGWGMVSLANRRREWVQYFPHSNVIFCSHARELLTQYLSLSQGLCHSEINEEKVCQIPWSGEILKKLGVWSNLNLERLHFFLRRN